MSRHQIKFKLTAVRPKLRDCDGIVITEIIVIPETLKFAE